MSKSELNTKLNTVFEYTTANFVNETDYCNDTAKVFWACDMLDKTSDEELVDVLDMDEESPDFHTDILAIRTAFNAGCDRYLKSGLWWLNA